MNIYSLFDRKLKTFGQLVLDRNDFAVQRGLLDALTASADTLIAKHPEDFDLYHVGAFDEETGKVEGHDFKLVCCLRDLIPSTKVEGVGSVGTQLPLEFGRRVGPLGKEGVSG